MKNRVLFISIISFLTTGIILNTIKNRKLINKYNQLYGVTNSIREENTLLREGFFHFYDFETVSINFSGCVQDYKLDYVDFKKLLKKDYTLVLFIHVESCNSCTYENIKSIKKLHKDSKLNVLICIEGLNTRKFEAFVSNNDISDIAYLLPDGTFGGFYLNPVVYCVVDKSLNTKYFFSPSNIYPDLTQDYFSKIGLICN